MYVSLRCFAYPWMNTCIYSCVYIYMNVYIYIFVHRIAWMCHTGASHIYEYDRCFSYTWSASCIYEVVCVDVCGQTLLKGVRGQVFSTYIWTWQVLLVYMNVCTWKRMCEHPLMVYECVCECVCVNVCVWTTFEDVHFQIFLTCIRMCEVLVIYMNVCVSICVWEHPVGVYERVCECVCVNTL